MKEIIGYLIIIVIGVLGIVSMMFRSEAIDNNLSKQNNTIEIFS